MKHLKLFEQRQELWIVVVINLVDKTDSEFRLFDNQESAENYYITVVDNIIKYASSQRSSWQGNREISTFKDAELWLADYGYEYYVNFDTIKIESEFDLPEHIKMLRDTKKYNL